MSYVFPVVVDDDLTGSAVAIAPTKENLYFGTALHCLGTTENIAIAIPPHGGDCTRRQSYPVEEVPTAEADVVVADQFADLALLSIPTENLQGGLPPQEINTTPDSLSVGDEVVVLGYPFAPLGSVLETWNPAHVTALGERKTAPGVAVDEMVLSVQSHPGMSGGAVVGKEDGTLQGIVRGSLAPPSVIKTAGNVSLGTDTSVTFATAAHQLMDLLEQVDAFRTDA